MVIVLRGCSGTGKSTWVRENGVSYGAVEVFSADHFFEDEDGVYNFNPTKLGEAHAECLRRFTVAAMTSNNDKVLIVDNTNTTAVEVAPYASLALAYGHALKIVTLVTDHKIAHERNAHGVPKKTVQQQAERLQRSIGKLPPWWPETVVEL